MCKILVVDGGYAGFYTAWELQKKLRRDEAELTIVDPRPGDAFVAAGTPPSAATSAPTRTQSTPTGRLMSPQPRGCRQPVSTPKSQR